MQRGILPVDSHVKYLICTQEEVRHRCALPTAPISIRLVATPVSGDDHQNGGEPDFVWAGVEAQHQLVG